MNTILNLSVHDIVDVLLRRGHLDTRVFNQSSMEEGSRLHALYQSEQGADYLSEYPLECTFTTAEFTFIVSGKADGVIISPSGAVTVEEIKTTVADLDEFIHDHGEWHLGQAKFYAYIIAKQRNLDSVKIVLTYLKQSNYHISKRIEQTYSIEDLQFFIDDLILRYGRYMEKIERLKEERDESVQSLTFPYQDFRDGQKAMMDFVGKAADEEKKVFVEAPTGIGKTVSVLYPLVKRFGEKKADRIFYLTAKNSIKKIAMSTLGLFLKSGAKVKAIEFTSKENLCFNDKKGHCNPDECPFARNYYDKLYDAIFDSLEQYDGFDRSIIEQICYRRKMCPFEFQIDLSRYCDVLVCDYSYVFDFHDRLGLEESGIQNTQTYLCVDECHNLPDRVRDMYSIEIPLSHFTDALSLCGGVEFKSLRTDIQDCVALLEKTPIDPEDVNVQKERLSLLKSIDEELIKDLFDVLTDIKTILKKHTSLVTDPLLEFFYEVNSFYYLSGLVNDDETGPCFLTYVRVNDDLSVASVRIACLDSKPLIEAGADLFRSVVYFSATLSPKDYYIDLLGGDKNDLTNRLVLPTPFPYRNRKVLVDTNLSLKYKDREETLFPVYCLVKAAISSRKGNYFVFCPSFDYLENLRSYFDSDPIQGITLIAQERSMSEGKRDEFLSQFAETNEKTTVGLLVIGGVFSEGIDLIGDRLIGAIVISVGLPQVSFERDALKDYYDSVSGEEKKGFSYAYSYPGANRILQAAGRVIRSETDQGFILFIDQRYRYELYTKIFAELYPDARKVISASELRYQLRKFWEDCHK
jgi:DNA excision repair protein ERCC-2